MMETPSLNKYYNQAMFEEFNSTVDQEVVDIFKTLMDLKSTSSSDALIVIRHLISIEDHPTINLSTSIIDSLTVSNILNNLPNLIDTLPSTAIGYL